MQFVYKPEGADPRRWDFEPSKLMNPEAEAIERHTGMTYAQWADKVSDGSMLALHGLLFVMLKRTNPTLKWDEVQFCLDECDFELTDEESAEARDALLAKAAREGLDADELALLDRLNESVAASPAEVTDDPKEAAKPSDESTPSP